MLVFSIVDSRVSGVGVVFYCCAKLILLSDICKFFNKIFQILPTSYTFSCIFLYFNDLHSVCCLHFFLHTYTFFRLFDVVMDKFQSIMLIINVFLIVSKVETNCF